VNSAGRCENARIISADLCDGDALDSHTRSSTGEFDWTQAQDQQSLHDEIARVRRRLFAQPEQKAQTGEIDHVLDYDSTRFCRTGQSSPLCEHFKVKSLDGSVARRCPRRSLRPGQSCII